MKSFDFQHIESGLFVIIINESDEPRYVDMITGVDVEIFAITIAHLTQACSKADNLFRFSRAFHLVWGAADGTICELYQIIIEGKRGFRGSSFVGMTDRF